MSSSSTTSSTAFVTVIPIEDAPLGRGRPQLLTVELMHEIAKRIRVFGLSDSHAGLLTGVSSSSVSRWRQASEEFRDVLERARAEFERDRVLALLEAVRPDGLTDWRAHAWLLRNASREGGYGKAANPLPNTAPKNLENLPKNTLGAGGGDAEGEGGSKKPENLPKNTSLPGLPPAPAEPAAAEGDATNALLSVVPASPDSASRPPCGATNPNSVPKIVPGEPRAVASHAGGSADGATQLLSRVA
ncbi:MAG: hypothetical protein JWM88_3216 [Verrucomicrobia bacterium]|nr:hypothetical protein [Verrucomicrobiota bacterium]